MSLDWQEEPSDADADTGSRSVPDDWNTTYSETGEEKGAGASNTSQGGDKPTSGAQGDDKDKDKNGKKDSSDSKGQSQTAESYIDNFNKLLKKLRNCNREEFDQALTDILDCVDNAAKSRRIGKIILSRLQKAYANAVKTRNPSISPEAKLRYVKLLETN